MGRPSHAEWAAAPHRLRLLRDRGESIMFVGEQTHLLWPAHFDLRRVALRDPEPVYPHSLVWRRDNRHPALTALRGYLRPARREAGTWTPPWARQAA